MILLRIECWQFRPNYKKKTSKREKPKANQPLILVARSAAVSLGSVRDRRRARSPPPPPPYCVLVACVLILCLSKAWQCFSAPLSSGRRGSKLSPYAALLSRASERPIPRVTRFKPSYSKRISLEKRNDIETEKRDSGREAPAARDNHRRCLAASPVVIRSRRPRWNSSSQFYSDYSHSSLLISSL